MKLKGQFKHFHNGDLDELIYQEFLDMGYVRMNKHFYDQEKTDELSTAYADGAIEGIYVAILMHETMKVQEMMEKDKLSEEQAMDELALPKPTRQRMRRLLKYHNELEILEQIFNHRPKQ